MIWNRKLSRQLTLKDGRTLLTLKDARKTLLAPPFATVTYSEVLDYTAELLLRAAQTGKEADIRRATDQMERALRMWGRMA